MRHGLAVNVSPGESVVDVDGGGGAASERSTSVKIEELDEVDDKELLGDSVASDGGACTDGGTVARVP